MKRIRAGELRHKATLQKRCETRKCSGGFDATWEDVCDVWVKIMPMSATETLQNQQLQSRTTHKVLMRYMPELESNAASYRLLYKNSEFRIEVGLDSSKYHRCLELRCEERVRTFGEIKQDIVLSNISVSWAARQIVSTVLSADWAVRAFIVAGDLFASNRFNTEYDITSNPNVSPGNVLSSSSFNTDFDSIEQNDNVAPGNVLSGTGFNTTFEVTAL